METSCQHLAFRTSLGRALKGFLCEIECGDNCPGSWRVQGGDNQRAPVWSCPQHSNVEFGSGEFLKEFGGGSGGFPRSAAGMLVKGSRAHS